MKRYLFDMMMNTRDLGGYKTSSGKKTKLGRFIRSDAPLYLGEEGKASLAKLGITTVIDLRTEEIANRYISVLKDDPRFQYFNFPITEGSAAYSKNDDESPFTYMKMLDHPDCIKQIILTMIQSKGGVFFNCTAGKDRTGIVAFLLLDLAGVSRNDILDDYVVSGSFIDERIPIIRALHPSFPSTMGFSKREYLTEFYELFDNAYGSAEGYLLKAGLTPEQLQILKNKLTK